MKNRLRLIVIVLKTAVAAYPIGCVGLPGCSNSDKDWKGSVVCNRRSIEMIRQSQKQEGHFASFEDTAAHISESFIAEAPERWHGNRTGPIGDPTEKLRPHAVRRLYLAIVNRAILDALENGRESREAKRWLLSRDFDRLQAAVE
jgi:hypothetical protein